MTDQQLRDLLHERVADVTTPDLGRAAWVTGRRPVAANVCRHGRGAVLSAAVAAAVTVLGDRRHQVRPAPAPRHPVGHVPDHQTRQVCDPPLATSRTRRTRACPSGGAPTRSRSSRCPRLLPAAPVIDLAVRVKAIDYAVAAFSVDEGQAVLLTGPTGGQVSVDISFLDDVTKPNGYSYRPVHEAMLSPTGRYLVFPQDGSVQVYDVAEGTWRQSTPATARPASSSG